MKRVKSFGCLTIKQLDTNLKLLYNWVHQLRRIKMKLFLIEQYENRGQDTYDSAVVVASDEKTARNMNPGNGGLMSEKEWVEQYNGTWCSTPNKVVVTYLGKASKEIASEVHVCSSFRGY